MTQTTTRRPITRNDVARFAGVSTAVVSYVINNGPRRVAPETERRVREAVKILGYQPNLTARALSSGKTHTFGLIVPDLVNPFFAELAYAVERAANDRGFRIVIGHTEAQPEAERTQAQELEARQVDGLLLASVFSPNELDHWSRQRQREPQHSPTVLLQAWAPVRGLSSVGPDYVAGSRLAVAHLLGHGHDNVALITGSPRTDPLEPREAGWKLGHTEAGRRPGRISRGDYSRESGYRLTRKLLESRKPPTAIFAVSDLMAIGAIRAAHELKVAIPEELAIVSFDGTGESEYCWPPLTSVRQPFEEMARAAVAQLLEPNREQSTHQVFGARLVIRRSCGCPGD